MMKPNFPMVILSGIGVVIVGFAAYLANQHNQLPVATAPLVGSQSVILKGTALKGALFSGTDSNGNPITLKIQDVEVDPKDPLKEIYLYTVIYQEADAETWQNFCQRDQEDIAKAIPLSGQWDEHGDYHPEGITFACTDGVLAKCARWGYKPWKTEQGMPLRDFHQACTRMLRADYCGDGTPHTQNGVLIDVYDRLGIQERTKDSGMLFEAAWGPDGAVAISRTRFPEMFARVQEECPERIKPLENQSLDDGAVPILLQYAPDALVFNDSFATPQIQGDAAP